MGKYASTHIEGLVCTECLKRDNRILELEKLSAFHIEQAKKGDDLLLKRIRELKRQVSDREMEKAQADAGWALELEKAEAKLERVREMFEQLSRWADETERSFTFVTTKAKHKTRYLLGMIRTFAKELQGTEL